MKSLKEQFIAEVVGETIKRVGPSHTPRILDLGCGTASYVLALREQFPNFEYVGVEPIPKSYEAAEKNLATVPNATLHFKLGYDEVPGEVEQSFDLVFSLSTLEHIKQLGRFIALSAKYAKTGGLVVHRYDLGHALHTHSLKERIHVFLGNTCPKLLPERQFVRYVPEAEVRELYHQAGVTPIKTTYHQMMSHKHLEKFFTERQSDIVSDLFAFEMKHQADFQTIPLSDRERLLPAVAVWGEKK